MNLGRGLFFILVQHKVRHGIADCTKISTLEFELWSALWIYYVYHIHVVIGYNTLLLHMYLRQ